MCKKNSCNAVMPVYYAFLLLGVFFTHQMKPNKVRTNRGLLTDDDGLLFDTI